MEISCELIHVDTVGNARIVEDAASDWNGYELFNQSSPPTRLLGEEDKVTCDPPLAELDRATVNPAARHVKPSSPRTRNEANRPPITLYFTFANYFFTLRTILSSASRSVVVLLKGFA
jgi:hypothetical protein